MKLTEREVLVLAYKVAVRELEDTESWLEWEDYPNLGQGEFEAVDHKIRTIIAPYLRAAMRDLELVWRLDAADILERTK